MTATPPTDTRSRLVEATIELIETDGEAGVRIERVAEMVGVSKASVYHFFGDREGLVTAALAEAYGRVMRRGLASLDALLECETREDFMALLTADMPSFVSPEGALARRKRIQILGSAVTRPELQDAIRVVHQDIIDELTKFLAYGQRRDWLSRRFDPELIAEWWIGLILGRHMLEGYGRDPDRPDWLVATLTAVGALIAEEPLPMPTGTAATSASKA